MRRPRVRKSVRRIKRNFMRIVKMDNTPHSIALGFAIGTFIAIFPTAGLDIPIAIVVALIYKKVNKLSLFGSFLFWNPIFSIPVMAVSYQVGNALFGNDPMTFFTSPVLNHLADFGRRFAAGLALSAVVVSIISYFVVRVIVEIYQRRHKLMENVKNVTSS